MVLRQSGIGGAARFLVAPRVVPPLDPGFRPAVLARRSMDAAIRESGGARSVALAVEQPGGAVWIRDALVFDEGHPDAPASYAFCERRLKSMLWTCGGTRVWVDGPAPLAAHLQRHYRQEPTGTFDARMSGEMFRHEFEVVAAPRSDFPISADPGTPLGRHLDGCRIGFDLGASDRKAAAVMDGEVVFSEETAWDPANHADPQWHFDQINDSLLKAAAHLPRVDAIGGSAAGVYVDNEIRAASLFRSVPREVFDGRVRGLFVELQRAWNGIPFVVVNDGEVTALAGAMLTGVGGLLGVAMGSSEAGGYVTPAGALTSRINELAFAPIDYASDAPLDEWSGDRGCGVQYLSQQAVGRLLVPAGIDVEPAMPLPEQLVRLQELMANGDPRATRVYETIGTYLGYALLEYLDWYEFGHLLLLGRVTTGAGGDVIADRAREAMRAEDPAAAAAVAFHTVSEREKRHGQAVAAASLPAIPG